MSKRGVWLNLGQVPNLTSSKGTVLVPEIVWNTWVLSLHISWVDVIVVMKFNIILYDFYYKIAIHLTNLLQQVKITVTSGIYFSG